MANYLVSMTEAARVSARDLEELSQADLSSLAGWFAGGAQVSAKARPIWQRLYSDLLKLPSADRQFILQYKKSKSLGTIVRPATCYDGFIGAGARVVSNAEQTVAHMPNGEVTVLTSNPVPTPKGEKVRSGITWLVNFLTPLIRIKKGKFALMVNEVEIEKAQFTALKKGALGFLFEFVNENFSANIISGTTKQSFKGAAMLDWWFQLLSTIDYIDYVCAHTYIAHQVLEAGHFSGTDFFQSSMWSEADKASVPVSTVSPAMTQKFLEAKPRLANSSLLPFRTVTGTLPKSHKFVGGVASPALAYQCIAEGLKLRGGSKGGIGCFLHNMVSSGMPTQMMTRQQTQLSYLLVDGLKADVENLDQVDIVFYRAAWKHFKVNNDVRFVVNTTLARNIDPVYRELIVLKNRDGYPVIRFDYTQMNVSLSSEVSKKLSAEERYGTAANNIFTQILEDHSDRTPNETFLYVFGFFILPVGSKWFAHEVRVPYDGFGCFMRGNIPPLSRVGSPEGVSLVKHLHKTPPVQYQDWARRIIGATGFANSSFLSVPVPKNYDVTNLVIPTMDAKIKIDFAKVEWECTAYVEKYYEEEVLEKHAATTTSVDHRTTTTTTVVTSSVTAPSAMSSSSMEPARVSMAVIDDED